jgi:hypothetical protein
MRRSLLLTLGHPDWWAMALAGFLVRGGILVIALPVLALPTLAALSAVVAPLLSGVALGDSSIPPIALLAGTAALVSAVLFVTGLVGAWLDVALFGAASGALGGPGPAETGGASLREALNARLAPHAITILALGFAVFRLVGAGYEELTSPTTSPAPLAARIVAHAPEAVAALVVAWLIAEAIGGVALRRYVAAGQPRTAGGAVVTGIRGVLRPNGIATLVITDVVVLGLGVAVWLAASATWTRLADRLADGAGVQDLGVALLAFIIAWLAGLLLFGVALAWRAVSWTDESIRVARPGGVAAPANEPAGEVA